MYECGGIYIGQGGTQFKKITDEMLLLLGFGVPFGIAVGLGILLHSMGVTHVFGAGIFTVIGLIIILIGRMITARLYEKIDL